MKTTLSVLTGFALTLAFGAEGTAVTYSTQFAEAGAV